MRNPKYSTVDSKTGNITYNGPLEIMKGNHDHMPARSDAYLPGDERGHINGSSLGGINSTSNVAAQNRDVNHGGYLSVERGERTALKNGAVIDSEKTAIVDSKPGDRPNAFIVNDRVTYSDGHTEQIHHSFVNESYAVQSEWNNMSAALPGTFDASSPGDSLRDLMDATGYAEMMEATDAQLPDLDADYAPADFSSGSGNDVNSDSTETDVTSEASADSESSDSSFGCMECSADADSK